MNFSQIRHYLNFSRACIMASISLSHTKYVHFMSFNFLLSNAMGCLCCVNTAPIPSPEASQYSSNGEEKLGFASTGQELITSFRVSKALYASSFQEKAPCLVRSVREAVSLENPFTNLL